MKFDSASVSEAYKCIDPELLYEKHLENGMRLDGRQMLESRPVLISNGDLKGCDASSSVRIGNTKAMCGINARLCKPILQSPGQGLLHVRTQTNFSHPFQRSMKRNAVLSDLVSETFLSSHFLNLSDLCVKRGALCWCLMLDLTVIEDCGSLIDALVLASVIALKRLKLPKVNIDEEFEVESVDVTSSECLKLSESVPLLTSFASLPSKRGNVIVMDPSTQEEELPNCGLIRVTVIGEKCKFSQNGAVILNSHFMFEEAKKRTKILLLWIHGR